MNEKDLRVLNLHEKIEHNKKISKQIKLLALVCLFFSLCYCRGTVHIGNVSKDEIVVTNIVWIISAIALIGIYIKDSKCIKNNKAYELEIYRLEVEALNDKKEIAEITGEILPDYILNQHIYKPDENVKLPTSYYVILFALDIMIRISLIGSI